MAVASLAARHSEVYDVWPHPKADKPQREDTDVSPHSTAGKLDAEGETVTPPQPFGNLQRDRARQMRLLQERVSEPIYQSCPPGSDYNVSAPAPQASALASLASRDDYSPLKRRLLDGQRTRGPSVPRMALDRLAPAAEQPDAPTRPPSPSLLARTAPRVFVSSVDTADREGSLGQVNVKPSYGTTALRVGRDSRPSRGDVRVESHFAAGSWWFTVPVDFKGMERKGLGTQSIQWVDEALKRLEEEGELPLFPEPRYRMQCGLGCCVS
eukprot:TRINITY_DN80579_c0_g1_i1.p1 TRINITY_DN80579_c0_g1~~TRINITY_DN80579_c0_g1_i1.p1  ORF type:complete len:268 (-),score=36.71 TRINITY_DN80579_c0_g1_i1:33-836(-)